jgi:hypothetical protein
MANGMVMLTLSLADMLDIVDTWPGSTTAELSRRSPKTQQAISLREERLEQRLRELLGDETYAQLGEKLDRARVSLERGGSIEGSPA